MPKGVCNQTGISPHWKGDAACYRSKHQWVSYHFGRPQKCEDCKTNEKKMYHWANISGEYKRERNDWKRLCVPCHNKMDIHLAERGEARWNSKLNAKKVRAIRNNYNKGLFQSHLAKMFNVSQVAISLVVRGVTWKHIL